MKRLVSILALACFTLSAIAADVTVWSIKCTGAATNGDFISCTTPGVTDSRAWADTVTTAATQIQTTNTAANAASQLYAHLVAYPFAHVTATLSGTTNVVLTGEAGYNFRIGVSVGWCSDSFYSTPQNTVEDRSGKTMRYRGGSVISFDSRSSIADEGASWTLSNTQLGKLAVLQSGTAALGNYTTNRVTFSTGYSATPVLILTAGTNDLPHLVSVTKTNFTIGAAQTNASVRWVSIGSP